MEMYHTKDQWSLWNNASNKPKDYVIYAADIAVTSYERDEFLNHRQLECLFNSLFYLIEKRTSNLHINGSLWYQSTPHRLVSLHKRPVMTKVFLIIKYSSTHVRNWHIFLIFVTAFSRFFLIYPHSYSRLRQSQLHLNKEQLKILAEQEKKCCKSFIMRHPEPEATVKTTWRSRWWDQNIGLQVKFKRTFFVLTPWLERRWIRDVLRIHGWTILPPGNWMMNPTMECATSAGTEFPTWRHTSSKDFSRT